MITCEVGFKVSENICSVNMIWSNTGDKELESIMDTATRKAMKHGYEISYIKPISESECEEKYRKGMPMYMIDEESERKYDPSFNYPF